MTQNTVNVRATSAEVRRAISRIPQEAQAGRTLADAMMRAVGEKLLGLIKDSFIAKSEGGMDEAGDRWEPLSRQTLLRRKRKKKRDIRRASEPSAKQSARWRELYQQGLALYGGDKGSASRRAWAILRGEGAVTLLNKYGGTRSLILVVTGRLLNSLYPGLGSPDQVFRVGWGEVTVGTRRQGALAQHEGAPGRLPQRRLWPEPYRWPATWRQALAEVIRDGLVDIAVQMVRDAG